MLSTTFFFFLIFNLVYFSYSLQSGYTCESSVTVTCPKSKIIVILEVTYSTECKDELNNTSIYPPSSCIGYYRDRTASDCNGKETCTIDNSPERRPSFFNGKQANCAFRGQSINIEYSCIPNFYSKELPSSDICSSKTLDGMKEGFIYSPNYPDNYPNNLTCSKTIPIPESGYRLKIYAVNFDIENIRLTRLTSITQINDWLEINDNGEKFYGTRTPYTLLFDDVIEASLTFQTDSMNTKRVYHGFLLYFIVTPIRRARPRTSTTNTEVISEEASTIVIQSKTAALLYKRNKSNVTLVLLVVLLSGILVAMIVGFLLYKRRNDRRIRYLNETFNSFLPKRPKPFSTDKIDETKLNLKPESSSVCKDIQFENSEHIYSDDPLQKKNNENAYLYECIDYDTINQQLKSKDNNL